MARIKTIVVLLFLFFGVEQLEAQVYTFSTSGISVLQKNKSGSWGNWSDLDLVNILVKLDSGKNRIVVYSEVIQLFEITEYIPLQENETDKIYTFLCTDNDGEACTLSIITRKNQDNRKQLYIRYDNRVILYNIHNYK